jgi:hypothetical protein
MKFDDDGMNVLLKNPYEKKVKLINLHDAQHKRASVLITCICCASLGLVAASVWLLALAQP